MSSIGWVDFSSDDRTRVQEVLALLKEPGTLDELGVGQVRDAFSDTLFPGFSTIQTRARYFLAVPKILSDWAALSHSKRTRTPLAVYLRNAENELAARLKTNYEALGLEPANVIGHTMVERGGVARRPSSTYWNGLRIFNIVNSSKSLAEFSRDWKQGGHDVFTVDADDGHDDSDQRFESEVRRPPCSDGLWRDGLTLDLNEEEAAFLSKRFSTAKGLQDSVAAQLISNQLVTGAIVDDYQTFAAFSVWAGRQSRVSNACRRHIANAQRFSAAIEGAHIIFNRLLAEKLHDANLHARCIDELQGWRVRVRQNKIFHSGAPSEWLESPVEIGATFSINVRVKPSTLVFLKSWNDAMCSNATDSALDKLVHKQAVDNKPKRSLLIRLPKKGPAWFGMKELDYRWQTARRMLRDLVVTC